jgi:RecA-family ATPase
MNAWAEAAAEWRHDRDRTAPQYGGQTIIPAPERKSTFYSAADLAGRAVPSRSWLVDELVPGRTVTLLGGDGGTGKSLLALQLAVACTARTSWIGRAVEPCNAIFMSAEDDDAELHRRLDAILSAEKRDYGDLAGLTMRSLAGENALLAVESQLSLIESELFRELEQRATEDGPGLIVIDTLADVYPAKENDRAKVRQFIGMLRGLSLRQNCAVVLLAHPSLTGLNSGSGASGSTAWNNSVRSRLYMHRITDDRGGEADPDKRILSVKKANYGRTGQEYSLTWRAGVFVPDGQTTGLDRMAANAKADRVFLDLLRKRETQQRPVNDKGATTYAPTVFATMDGNEGMTKAAFRAAMERLLDAGKIKVEVSGPPSKQRSKLVEVRP